jgi:hypothetical protein
VSFTQTISQMVPSVRPDLLKEASQTSLSMSSLIDFENNRSSQEDDMQMIEDNDQPEPVAAQDAHKKMMLEVSLSFLQL